MENALTQQIDHKTILDFYMKRGMFSIFFFCLTTDCLNQALCFLKRAISNLCTVHHHWNDWSPEFAILIAQVLAMIQEHVCHGLNLVPSRAYVEVLALSVVISGDGMLGGN